MLVLGASTAVAISDTIGSAGSHHGREILCHKTWLDEISSPERRMLDESGCKNHELLNQ